MLLSVSHAVYWCLCRSAQLRMIVDEIETTCSVEFGRRLCQRKTRGDIDVADYVTDRPTDVWF